MRATLTASGQGFNKNMKPTWKFFPVLGKAPALEGDWRKHSTSDPAQLNAWRAAGYSLALDCGASNVFVVDCDPGGVLPEAITTASKKTPRGRHLLLEGQGPSTAGKLAEHIDTRGVGGYIVYEGPGYGPLEGEIAPIPAWVLERVAVLSDGKAASVEGADAEHNLARAAAWLAQQEPAIEGAGGDDRTYKVLAGLLDLADVEGDKALALLAPWNARCMPPWSLEELTIKLENALAYRQNDVGAWAQPPHGERFAGATFDREAGKAPVGRRPLFYAYSVEEQDHMPLPRMVVPDFLPDQALTMLYGAPGSLKSFLALDFALTLSSGSKGWGYTGDEQPVVFAAGEGPRSIARQRRPAWEREHRLDGVDYPFHLVARVPRAAVAGEVEEFIEQVRGQGISPRVVVIDTLSRLMEGLNENDVKDVSAALSCLEGIRDAFNCAVLVIHHTGYVGGGERPRGSSALPGGFDTLHEVNRPNREDTLVSIKNRLQKDGEERAEAWCFEGHKVLSSLVFRPITASQMVERTKRDDGLGPKRIAAMLVALGALGAERGVATAVVAAQLYQAKEGETPEAVLAAQHELVTKLRARAKGSLAPYCDTLGRELKWFIPAG